MNADRGIKHRPQMKKKILKPNAWVPQGLEQASVLFWKWSRKSLTRIGDMNADCILSLSVVGKRSKRVRFEYFKGEKVCFRAIENLRVRLIEYDRELTQGKERRDSWKKIGSKTVVFYFWFKKRNIFSCQAPRCKEIKVFKAKKKENLSWRYRNSREYTFYLHFLLL